MRLDLIGASSAAILTIARDHVGALGKLERERRLLLDQQDAEAAAVELAQVSRIPPRLGARPSEGSSSISSFGPPSGRGRPPASAARRRRETRDLVDRSFRRGNSGRLRRRRSISRSRCRACRRRARGSRAPTSARTGRALLHHDDAAPGGSCVARRLTSSPLNRLAFAATSRVIARSRVVLPAPFGPRT